MVNFVSAWGSILIALRLSESMFAKDKLDQSDTTP